MKHISFYVIVVPEEKRVGVVTFSSLEAAEKSSHIRKGSKAYARKVTINIKEGRDRGPVGEMGVNRGGDRR